MRRKIITIDEEKCTGCEECIPNCPEGAIQMIDGKARLISDLFCDGLGACLGHCPEGAITVEEREAEPYDERRVMENVVRQGRNVIAAHLEHLKEHNEERLLGQALAFLREQNIPNPMEVPNIMDKHHAAHAGGCPGSRSMDFAPAAATVVAESAPETRHQSELTHWPIQLHLISPLAPHFLRKDLLFAADCVPFTLPDFHRDYLRGKTLAIACPKLDDGQDSYLEKLVALIDHAEVNTITVIIMQVPCCSGLVRLAQDAVAKASRKVPVKVIVVGLRGEILQEKWV
ncbi:MAG: 4Fe-4S binding protein [Acidobacteriota bacterium]